MSKENLLKLDRKPTLEELRTFFKNNDWSATKLPDCEDAESLEYIKSHMDNHWEQLSSEMGLKSSSQNYSKDNPLIAMRDNVEDIVAKSVLNLIDNQPKRVEEILSHFMTEEAVQDFDKFSQNVDNMLNNAVKTTMQTMNFEEIASVLNQSSAHEDFNNNPNNLRAKDFDRKWNHTRAKTKTESIQNLEDTKFDNENSEEILKDYRINIEDEAITNIAFENFWDNLSKENKEILALKMGGLSQKEIAEKLGYKTHSTITKKLQKLKEEYIKLST